jgi:hypothetical protein
MFVRTPAFTNLPSSELDTSVPLGAHGRSGVSAEGHTISLGLLWRWGVIVALGGRDASRERFPCLQWPVDPLGELHSGVNALPRRSESDVGMSSWPSVVVIQPGSGFPAFSGRLIRSGSCILGLMHSHVVQRATLGCHPGLRWSRYIP